MCESFPDVALTVSLAGTREAFWHAEDSSIFPEAQF